MKCRCDELVMAGYYRAGPFPSTERRSDMRRAERVLGGWRGDMAKMNGPSMSSLVNSIGT